MHSPMLADRFSAHRNCLVGACLFALALTSQPLHAQHSMRAPVAAAPARPPTEEVRAPHPGGTLSPAPGWVYAYDPTGCKRPLVAQAMSGSGIPSGCRCPVPSDRVFVNERGDLVCKP